MRHPSFSKSSEEESVWRLFPNLVLSGKGSGLNRISHPDGVKIFQLFLFHFLLIFQLFLLIFLLFLFTLLLIFF